MATRKFIICAGQSNGSTVGDALTWWEQNPSVALADPTIPASQLPQYAQGAYSDRYTMPITFKGGRQTGQYGLATDIVGQYQTVNLRGVASGQIRYLTPFNPISTFLSNNLITADYPGTSRVLGNSEPSRLLCNLQQQESEVSKPTVTGVSGNTITTDGHSFTGGEKVAFVAPGGIANMPDGMDEYATYEISNPSGNDFDITEWPSGAVPTVTSTGTSVEVHRAERGSIVRQATGTTHTIACAGPGTQGSAALTGNTINCDPPFTNPPPMAGETFTHEWIATDNSTTTTLDLGIRLGGLADTGHLLSGGAASASSARNPVGDHPTQITSKDTPFYAGRPVLLRLTTTSSLATLQTIASTASNEITITGHGLIDNDVIQFGSTGGGVTAGVDYYVRAATTDTFEVSATAGGVAVTLSSPTGAIFLVVPSSAQGIQYVTRVADDPTITVLGVSTITSVEETVDFSNDKFDFGVDYRWVENEPVILTGSDLPDPIVSGRTYYVKLMSEVDEIQISEAPGGSALTLTDAGVGAVTFTRPDQCYSWFFSSTPGGSETRMTARDVGYTYDVTMQAQFRGSLSGLEIECTSGTLTGDGAKNLTVSQLSGDIAQLVTDTAWSTAPANGDKFVIRPNNGVDFSDFSLILPWCPFEGKAEGDYPLQTVTVNIGANDDSSGDLIFAQGGGVIEWREGAPVKLYTTGSLPEPLLPGKVYYSTPGLSNWVFLSETPGGDRIERTKYVASNIVGNQLTVSPAHNLYQDEPVQVKGDDVSTAGLSAATTYYANVVDTTTVTFLDSPGGSTVTLSEVDNPQINLYRAITGTHRIGRVEQLGKSNPFPPGFNYPNDRPLPAIYQPYDGSIQQGLNQTIGHSTSTGLRIAEFETDTIDIVNVAFGGTSLAHREIVSEALSTVQGIAWVDYRQQLSWAPGEANNCYAVLVSRLAQLKQNYDDAGDIGECIGIFWVQGETDASTEAFANRYADNLKQFVAKLREDVKAAGLYSGAAANIPFIAPKVYEASERWTYASTVNTAIQAVADADSYMRAVETTTLSVQADDDAHYTGASMSLLSDLMLTEWKELRLNEDAAVTLCNRALLNIGESATITSISPSDGSLAADLGAEFYEVARDSILLRHVWDFATKRKTMTAETDSGRTEWLYAYRLPGDFMGVISVLPEEPSDDQHIDGGDIRLDYSIEANADGDLRLFCNQPDVVLQYQARVTETSKFSALFKETLSWAISQRIAPPILKGDKGVEAAQGAARMVEYLMQQAVGHDSKRKRKKRPNDTGLSEAHRERGAL